MQLKLQPLELFTYLDLLPYYTFVLWEDNLILFLMHSNTRIILAPLFNNY